MHKLCASRDGARNSGLLRTVPPFVTAHTFFSSRVWSEIFGCLKEFAYQYKVARFRTMRKKQILARAIRILKKIEGNHAFFRDN